MSPVGSRVQARPGPPIRIGSDHRAALSTRASVQRRVDATRRLTSSRPPSAPKKRLRNDWPSASVGASQIVRFASAPTRSSGLILASAATDVPRSTASPRPRIVGVGGLPRLMCRKQAPPPKRRRRRSPPSVGSTPRPRSVDVGDRPRLRDSSTSAANPAPEIVGLEARPR